MKVKNTNTGAYRGLTSRSSIEPLSSYPKSIRGFSKSTIRVMLRGEPEVVDSAFSAWSDSANLAIWSCIPEGYQARNFMDTIWWVVAGCGCVHNGA